MPSTGSVSLVSTGQLRFGLQPFRTLLIAGQSTQNTTDGYGSSNIIDIDQSSAWRTTSTGVQSVTLDLGASPPAIFTIYLYGANFRDYIIYSSSDNASFAAVGGTREVQLDTRVQIRKGWEELTGWNASNRYLRVEIQSQTPDSSVAYYELAEIIVVPDANIIRLPFGHNLPYDIEIFRPGKVFNLDSGSNSGVNLGRRRVRITTPAQVVPAANEEDVLRIASMDQDRAFLWIENLRMPTNTTRTTDTSRVYLVKQTGYRMTYNAEPVDFVLNLEEQ